MNIFYFLTFVQLPCKNICT